MKKILVILDGIVAKKLLDKMVSSNTNENEYDILYTDDRILPERKLSNFTFYNFDATSYSKLFPLISNNFYSEVIIVLNSKDETINVVKNIRLIKEKLSITLYDTWDIELEDNYIHYYKALEVLSNGLRERFPNTPVYAQNIGLREGEIMEIKIPFGSSYAYRYIGSIKQKDWKIFGLYRNQKLLTVKPSLVLKPNDIILVIGKPEILDNIYNIISKSQGQFPMPFGKNIYLYLDLLNIEEDEILSLVNKSIILQRKLHDAKLIVKVTNPSTMQTLDKIKAQFSQDDIYKIDIDYNYAKFEDTIKKDKNQYGLGLLVFSNTLLQYQNIFEGILKLKLPVFKAGHESLDSLKFTLSVLNDNHSYEQIASMLFDISKQLKTKVKLYDMDPLGHEKDSSLMEHFENLGTIFSQEVKIVNNEKNPIKELEKDENILQVLPLKKSMFEKRYFKFATLDTDMLSFDISKHNQILIPIIENNQE